MSSVIEAITYGEDAELVWRAALYYAAANRYTIYEQSEAPLRLVCRTPAATLLRSAGQVLRLTVRPLGPRSSELVIQVTSFNERREQWFAPWLLRVPREQLIDDMKGGISRLLPVMAPAGQATPLAGPGVAGQSAPHPGGITFEGSGSGA